MQHTIICVMGEGGHSAQMRRLASELASLGDVSFVAATHDTLVSRLVPTGALIDRARRPRGKDSTPLRTLVDTFRCCFDCLRILIRRRPTVVVSNGPGLGAVMCWLGWFAGARIIFVESVSRVTGLSMTGRLARPIADKFFVQWPQVHAKTPGSIYAGRLL